MRKKHHPYAMLAVFTLAGAGMINIYNRTKRFIVDKGSEMTKHIQKRSADK